MPAGRARSCRCGCGGWTRGGRFLPGHDAKLKSALLAAARAGQGWAIEELEELGWSHFLTGRRPQPVSALWNDRSFGIELECTVPDRYALEQAIEERGVRASVVGYTHRVMSSWKLTTDSSIVVKQPGHVGVEVVSPVLRGRDGIEQVRKVCEALAAVGARINKSCGFHAHFGIADLSLDQAKTLFSLYTRNQDAIDSVLPMSRRRGQNTFCRRYDEITIDQMMTARSVDLMASWQPSRYQTINFAAYVRQGTVEIRQHSGTIEFDKIQSWIAFGMGLIDAARRDVQVSDSASFGELAEHIGLDRETSRYFESRVSRLSA